MCWVSFTAALSEYLTTNSLNITLNINLFHKFAAYPIQPMEKQSFLGRFHDPIIVGAFCIIVPVVFSLGYFYGLQQTDRISVITKQRNQEMHDSLEIYRQKVISQELVQPVQQNATISSAPSKSY